MLSNSGEAQDIIADVAVRDYASDEAIAGLPLVLLEDVSGAASFSTQWDSSAAPAGDYYFDLSLKDTEGTTLDTMTSSFQLGIWDTEVVAFEAAPQEVTAGDTVDLSATLRNTGTVDISGEAVLRVTDDQGSTVSESRLEVVSLPASGTVDITDGWDTSGAAPGEYDIVCYMLYNGQATLASSATVTVSASSSGALALGLGIGLGLVFALGIVAVPWIRRRGGGTAAEPGGSD